jgi:hypothetical protein
MAKSIQFTLLKNSRASVYLHDVIRCTPCSTRLLSPEAALKRPIFLQLIFANMTRR